jgi:radical SAM protein with 4Fe4S-binding SPASM domain
MTDIQPRATVSDNKKKYDDPFLAHRRAQEATHQRRTHQRRIAEDDSPMASLISVEFNITELCNRTCVFCPRVDPAIYPNRNLNMDVAVAEKVAADLARIHAGSRISFSGFGEALLHKGFHEMIRAVRRQLPDNVIETNTNGDRLTATEIRNLFESGLTYLYVNLYDGPEQRQYFDDMFAEAGIDQQFYKLRPHWMGAAESYGLILNNRSGTLNQPDIGVGPLERPMENRCFYPFYKMIVDWNGDVLFCSNDWGREIIVGNVIKQRIDEIWLSDTMLEIRKRLSRGDRSKSPCTKCSVDGTLHGSSSYERLMKHYGDQGKL